MKNKQILEIHMFGEFSMCIGETCVSSKDAHSHKLWVLMQYLILRRGHIASQKELIDVLWPNSEISNPQNSLKALVFRLRKQLDNLGCAGVDVILQDGGGYAFNERYPYFLDIEYFELQCRLAYSANSRQKKLKLLTLAIKAFNGCALAQNQNELWAQEIFNQYNKLFRQAVLSVVELLSQNNDFQSIVDLCQNAIAVRPYEEIFYSHLIDAYVSMGDFSEASRQYTIVRNQFHTSLASAPISTSAVQNDDSFSTGLTADALHELQEVIAEEYNFGYSYYCAFEVFRSAYHLLARRLYRHPADAFLALFHIESSNPADATVPIRTDGAHIKMLGEAIAFSLRQSDVFTLYGSSRFLVIFESVTEEQLNGIYSRIKSYFDLHRINENYEMHFEALPISPSLPLSDKQDFR
ncbi:MAG: BTAD domain-containing putative transcriptional regulator [Oscillospiraceae bacterium]